MSATAAEILTSPLPLLREDLRLSAAAPRADGSPTWVVYDPLQHRYHEMEAAGYAVLALWRPGITFGMALTNLGKHLGRTVDFEELAAIVQHFERLGLLVEPLKGWTALHSEVKARKSNPFTWLLHNYLFMRLPLVRPQAFLVATLPAARLLATRFALALYALITLIGVYLVSREWDQFQGSLVHFLSLEGAAGYLVAIIAVKILHELGHAYVAVHFGCRVPTMGVALMVLAPVLYTDVTDAWRLKDRRQRTWIDGAGIVVELVIAGLATALWALLPEGAAKSAAFFVAAVSWIMSLAINLNPFMRFDAYYLLVDFLDIPNLQPRAFALMRWWLRELLFALGRPCPEPWSKGRRALIISYGLATAIYRLVLFIGIAVMVYVYAFKLLGILLFAVEILWFIAKPVWSELKIWWAMRGEIVRSTRSYAAIAAVGIAAILVATPWRSGIEIEAILEPTRSERLTAVSAARIVEILVRNGDDVSAGQVLMRLEAPKLEHEIALAKTRLELVETRLGRRSVDATDKQASMVLEGEAGSLREKLDGLQRLRQQLVLTAASDSRVVDVPSDLHPGRWVTRGEDLGLLIARGTSQLRGYATEAFATRLHVGAAGRFIPDDITEPTLDVRLVSIAQAGAATIEIPYLSTSNGGRIAVNEDKDRGGIPLEAQYLAVLAPSAPATELPRVIRGLVRLEGEPESYISRMARRAAAILVRESGF